MDESDAVLRRLERIEQLDRHGAPAVELVEELRALVAEAEAWSRREGGDASERAVESLRSALSTQALSTQALLLRAPSAEDQSPRAEAAQARYAQAPNPRAPAASDRHDP